MNNVENAVGCFKSGCNCAQAIVSVYGVPLGLDKDTALKLAAGFGGGMGRMGEVCGAVTGAFMVLGLKSGAAAAQDMEGKERTHALIREFTRRFKSRHCYIRCRELLGCDIGTAQGMQVARDRGLFTTLCPKLVEDAAIILEEMLAPGAGESQPAQGRR
jgi:C_GCAxxG_C_C family probable redox protein